MVWVFGDSFSADFDDQSNICWSQSYIDMKGYIPKSFGEIISSKLNCGYTNKSIGGTDNDTIYETICDNSQLINENDIIIIGWTSINRFRFPTNVNKWRTILSSHIDMTLSNVSEKTFEEIIYNRSSPVYIDELKKRITFLNWVFKNCVVIHWSPFKTPLSDIKQFHNIETIMDETNESLREYHYSERGHLQISNHIMELISIYFI